MWRDRRNLKEDALCTLVLAATSVMICSFVSSAVFSGNDLGWRGFLPAQFVLLLWGTDFIGGAFLSSAPWKRGLVVATLVLGVGGSCYSLFKIRFYPLQSDVTSTKLYEWLSPDRNLGARTYALRGIYDELRSETDPRAIFQHNPETALEDLFHGIYADRQVAAEGLTCSVGYGGDPALCKSRIGAISDLFDKPGAYQANQIDDVCERLSIDILVVKDTDKVWRDPESWVWRRTPLVTSRYAKAFACGPAKRSAWARMNRNEQE